MKSYNLTVLISPDLSDTERADYITKLENLISEKGAITSSTEEKKIALAYPIKKKVEAFLKSYDFNYPEEEITNFKNNLEKENNILRFLIIRN
jgi:ribosomal protein S6